MAKGKKGKSKKHSKPKPKIPILATAGATISGAQLYEIATMPALTREQKIGTALLYTTGYANAGAISGGQYATGSITPGLNLGWKGQVDFWTPTGLGLVGSAIGNKIPFVKSIPRRLPLIGKYLRW